MRTTTKITARQTWNKINETGQDPVNGSIALTVIIQHWYANKVEAANTQAQNLKTPVTKKHNAINITLSSRE